MSKDLYRIRHTLTSGHSWRWEFTLKFYFNLLTSTLFYKKYELLPLILKKKNDQQLGQLQW